MSRIIKYRWFMLVISLLLLYNVLPLKASLYHIFLQFFVPEYTAYIEANELEGAIRAKDVIVLDARSLEEYNVSHIADAIWVGYEAFDVAKVHRFPKDTCIVLYCSVGYRSDQIGRKLQKEGYKCVQNLYGGIFEWVNQGHTVYADGKNTKDIHPYSSTWGFWLSEGNKVNPD